MGFLLRRATRFAISLAILVTASFAMIHLVPGDPVRAALGTTAPAELVEARRSALGLDLPLWEQFLGYVRGLISGDLGRSIGSDLPVSTIIVERLPETLKLSLLATALTLAVALPLGITMAVLTHGGRRRAAELGFAGITGMLTVIPEFLLAVGLVFVFAITLQWLPVAGKGGPASYVLPVLALAAGPIAGLSRVVRVDTLTVLDQDYMRTARAKRLPVRLLYLRHALPNVLTSALTIAGMLVVGLIAGTVLVETVFAWPGLGATIVQSIQQKDYPLVQGIVLVYGTAVLVVNLLVDTALGVLSPGSTVRES
ncbi:ABC transporter permease [Nonomuraea sediminis]|uniref:ABC transporter permease n=1 Tax=Nonomuraea sediminis TaxID=2835864 RepID=UPI001BDD3EFA|nr:ABC transporter permease [Nonomuraea sediminis]